MPATDTGAGQGSATTARFRAAVEGYDIDAVLATCAEGVVLRSPIVDSVEFRGSDAIRQLLGSVFATIEDIRYFADIGDDHMRALFYRAHVGKQPVEEATRIVLDDTGRIVEITLFFRPLAAVGTAAAALAPRVARRRGRLRAVIARILISPLGPLTRIGEKVSPWFI